MVWLSVTDILWYKLPNKIILAWVICRTVLIFMLAYAEKSVAVIIQSLIGAFVMGFAFFVIYIISKKALGAGDVKYAFAMGLSLLLYHAFWAAVCGLVLCGTYAAFRILVNRKREIRELPLGPFLFMGSVFVLVL